jgi:hypothetical protein
VVRNGGVVLVLGKRLVHMQEDVEQGERIFGFYLYMMQPTIQKELEMS